MRWLCPVLASLVLAAAPAASAAPGDLWVIEDDGPTPGGPGAVLRVNPATGAQTIASDNAHPSGGAQFLDPWDAVFAPNGDLYVVDMAAFTSQNGGVIRVNRTTGARTAVSNNEIS